MNVTEVAESLRCSPATVHRFVEAGALAAKPHGDGWQITPKALERFVREHATAPKRSPPTATA